ncbi:mechanosensitive ion channel family protein [Haloarchaeobius sp. DFWS5]|uniref:mechanosensitive ion channel family protein n=1 Tax=Haloarchaeobius sp. DFWS5 TaxID=3446114 RepID=UPI003EB8C21F
MPSGVAFAQESNNSSTTTSATTTTEGGGSPPIPSTTRQEPGTDTGGNTGSEAAADGNSLEWLSREVSKFLREYLPEWIPTADIVNIVLAVAVLFVGWYASKLFVRAFGRTIAQQIQRPSITRTVLRMVRLCFLAIAAALASTLLGLGFGDILLSVTVFSAVLGIVLAPIVGSIINGVFVLADQPYEIGDMIELADRGTRGFVEDITIRYTKIFTLDNTFLVIPNSSIRNRDVINYSAEDERTRLSLQLTVTYEGDLDEARGLMEDAAKEVDEVIPGGPDIRIGSARYPAAPTAYIDNYADHGVLITLRYWAKQPYKLLTVRSKVQEQVWTRLDEADVAIAYPHSHVVFDETSGSLPISQRDGSSGSGRRARSKARWKEGQSRRRQGAGRHESDGGEERSTGGE